MTNHPTRAYWWREVTDQNVVIPAGCPVRREATPQTGFVTTEFLWPCDKTVGPTDNYTYFVDSRWRPSRPVYKVGDVIETVEDLERLPEEALLFSTQLHAYWMEKEGHFVAIGSDRWLVADEAASYGPFTIRWLPEPEGTK